MLEAFRIYILEELDVLIGAPLTFGLAVLLTGGLIWLAMRWRYGGIVDTLQSRLDARNDKIADYREKLEGASPDEAKARIDDLESRLQRLEPRRIAPEARGKMIEILSAHCGSIEIAQDMQSPDARGLAVALSSIFHSAGWKVDTPMVGGPSNPPEEGISVTIQNLADQSALDRALFAAMDQMGHPYVKRAGTRMHSKVDAEILLTSQA